MRWVILVTVLLIASVPVKAQYLENGLDVKDVVTVKDTSTSAAELYKRARLFFANEYHSAKAVISFDDQLSNTVIGEGFFEVSPWFGVSSVRVFHKIKIECKEGRYRYTIYDMNVETVVTYMQKTPTTVKRTYAETIKDIPSMREGNKKERMKEGWVNPMKKIIEDLKKYMGGEMQDNNW